MAKEEILLKLENYDKNIQERLQDFITGCFSLKESSNGQYQVQKTIELNKIYFQGYVLDSKICQNLKKDNITDYSLTTLKNYLNQNFNNLEIDCTPYYEALILYEKANALEDMVDEKIELEIDFLSEYVEEIKILKYEVMAKDKLFNFYKDIKEKLVKTLLSEQVSDITKNNYINILNNVFEFFWSGYPLIN